MLTMKNDINLKRRWLVVSKLIWGMLQIMTKVLEWLKNLSFDLWSIWSFWPKYIMFELKKYRGVVFHCTEEWCKIWRRTDLLFQKWQEFGEIWPRHSKISKIFTLIASFFAKYIMFDLKQYRWVIFKEKQTCGLENGMSNLANF